MALIPCGPNQGKVLVWDYFSLAVPTVGMAAPFSSSWWSFQRFSIIDPSTTPPTFANFFLPLSPLPAFPLGQSADLFCSGHAWSSDGYLAVVGGTEYANPPPTGLPGATSVWTFDPRRPQLGFPGSSLPFYGDPGSEWVKQPVTLAHSRFYPTATLTHRLPRAGTPTPILLVMGGSKTGSVPGVEWNTYEALQLLYRSTGPAVTKDKDAAGFDVWWGPGNPTSTPEKNWLLEYPRGHLLSNGNVFVSGYALESAQVDHSFTGALSPQPAALPWAQRWLLGGGAAGPQSVYRDGGASLLYPSPVGFPDLMIRIGGDDNFPGHSGVPTDTVEACFPTLSGAWFSAPPMGPTFAREHFNAVVLPERSVFVVGGQDQNGPIMTPQLWVDSLFAWVSQPQQSSIRNYHSTAVLLPDGRVLVGGGESRHQGAGPSFDYEIYRPWYMTGNPPPVRPANVTIAGATSTDPDGTLVLNRTSSLTLSAQSVGSGQQLARVVLMAPGSITHHSDMHARYVECAVTPLTATSIQFTLPAETRAPNGYYMVFAVTNTLVPSTGRWVRIP